MNNRNGAALLAAILPGDLVTVRRPDGSQATGRAYVGAVHGTLHIATQAPGRWPVTECNIIRSQTK